MTDICQRLRLLCVYGEAAGGNGWFRRPYQAIHRRIFSKKADARPRESRQCNLGEHASRFYKLQLLSLIT
jgi:hypothetical protein